MGDALPASSPSERDTIAKWAAAEEEGFGRTLAQGERLLGELIGRAKERGHVVGRRRGRVPAARHLRLPLRADQGAARRGGPGGGRPGLRRADGARARGRARRRVGAAGGGGKHERVIAFARDAGFQTRFVGYETTEAETVARRARAVNGRLLAKLAESPFYAEGGGQVVGLRAGRDRRPAARAVTDVFRVGDDQAVELELVEGELGRGRARARRGRPRRRGSPRCATTPPPTCCTPRCASGSARTCARPAPYVGPDKLRFDFTHGERLSAEELADVEERVNALDRSATTRVRAVDTTRDEAERARRDGAVRREVRRLGADGRGRTGVSRELCGGTHVALDRRDRPLPRAPRDVERLERAPHRGRDRPGRRRRCSGAAREELRELAAMLRVPEREVVRAVRKLQEQLKEAPKRPKADDRALAEALVGRGRGDRRRARGHRGRSRSPDAEGAARAVRPACRQTLGDAAVVLGTAVDGRVHLVANFAPPRSGAA